MLHSFKHIHLIGIVAILVLSSCGNNRKVYSSAYDVDWGNPTIDKRSSELISTGTPYINTKLSEIVEPSTDSLLSMTTIASTTKLHKRSKTFDNGHITIPITKLHAVSKLKKALLKKKNGDDQQGNRRTRGILTMLVALLLLGLAYIFYTMLGVIGILFGWIFGLGAAIYFLIGLVMVIVG